MENRKLFGVMCILFNSLGVPCFMQKENKKGLKRLLFSVITLGILGIVNAIKGIILGIEVLKMTDEEFAEKAATLSSGIPV